MVSSGFIEEADNFDLNFRTVKTDLGQALRIQFFDSDAHTFRFYFSLSIRDWTQQLGWQNALPLKYVPSTMMSLL